MSENLGTGVSYVYESGSYNNVMVVFQKGKPPLDSELNLAQEQQRLLVRRNLDNIPSGWLSFRPPYTSSSFTDKFYTQNPDTAMPEYAVVNGMALYVTNTGTSEANSNSIELSDPPITGNKVHGIFLEVWRALLDPDTDTNRPDATTVIDAIVDIEIYGEDAGWAVGENGLVLVTENGGNSWNEQLSNTKRKLNSISFINNMIGWAVGDHGTVIRTASGGQNWVVLPSGLTKNFNSVYAITQLVSWIVGDTGTILKTTNGITYLPQTSNVTVNLNSIYFHDSLVGWAVGDSGAVLRTTDGGSNWITLSSGVTANLSSVHFYDLNFGFAVGAGGTILRTSDGGLSWVDQSGNIKTSTGYTSLTADLTDVKMIPTIDAYVEGEEVSSQFIGSNKNFTTLNVPITKGNGLGETTNNPADVTVTVAPSPTETAVEALIDSVNGTTGQIILHEAPRATDTVKVFYWYKACGDLFRGNTWITGTAGTLIASNDIGANWFIQDPDTSYDLNAVGFSDESKGWVAGDFSVIRHTENGTSLTDDYDPARTIWTEQKSNVIVRQVQRVYKEGNVGTDIYLNDESIHPDTNIETTKRVQIQYKIRIVENVDPSTYPEAGLGSSAIVGLGPNTSGSFAFVNQGPITGDYGLWEADCSNTVDGKCWAIPMFFVNRRNSTAYDPEDNTNGSHSPPGNIRYDLLTGTDVVGSDIWDVRRKVLVPSVQELLDRNFDLLLDNELHTRFFRDTAGGDKYGTQILQLDRVGGATGDGGTLISSDILDAVAGDISSRSELIEKPVIVSIIDRVPDPVTLTIPTGVRGIFHPNLVYYTAQYISSDPTYNERTIPGYFSGMGTTEVTFTFGKNTNTDVDDLGLLSQITAHYIKFSTTGLTNIPSEPQLVKNYYSTGSGTFFYHGVQETPVTGKVIEQWDTGILGHLSYSLAYPAVVSTDLTQRARASTVEVHQFIRLTATEIVGTNEIAIPQTIQPISTESNTYSFYAVSKINNVESKFSYKIDTITYNVAEGKIHITSLTGYEFLEGAVIEVIAAVESSVGDDNIRNGATVNFIPSAKEVSSFCKSILITSTNPVDVATSSVTLSVPGGLALGVSATETESSLTQHFCWFGPNLTPSFQKMSQFVECTVTGIGTNSIKLTFDDPHTNDWYVTVQVLVLQNVLNYQAAGDGLLIGYNYNPYQSVSDLPLNLTVETVTKPTVLNISNLGTGGSSFEQKPYNHPLIHIPTNDSLVSDDNEFYNMDLLRFSNFTVDSGFAQMPVFIPGSFGEELELSIIAEDSDQRAFYSVCSKDFQFITEGIEIAVPRKIFIGVIARVKESSDDKLLKGEYVLLIISRNELLELGNYTGYSVNDKSVIAVYRLPNKPIIRK